MTGRDGHDMVGGGVVYAHGHVAELAAQTRHLIETYDAFTVVDRQDRHVAIT